MPAINLNKKKSFIKRPIRSGLSFALKPLWRLIPRAIYLGESNRKINIALTRVCNLNCVFCVYQHTRKEKKVHMSDQVFEGVLNDLKHFPINRIMLSPNIGEPLLAPGFLDKVKRLRGMGPSQIEVTTNGVCLHKVGIEAILRGGPDIINISFVGFQKEMYERDTRAKTYEQTRANILELLRMNREMGGARIVNLWLRGDLGLEKLLNMPEMKEVSNLANEISFMTEVDPWLGMITEMALPDGYRIQTNKAVIKKRPCALIFDLSIAPDGVIEVCSCRNVLNDPDLHIGNLKTITILEAHARIPAILKGWENGLIPESCQKCSMYLDPVLGFAGKISTILKNKFNTHS